MPARVEPTLTEEQTKSVVASASGIDAAGLCRPIQSLGKGDVVLRLAARRHQGNGGDGDAFVHNGDAELCLDLLAGGDQPLCLAADLVIDLAAADLWVRVGAGEEGDAHGNGSDVQMLLIDHPQRLLNFTSS